MGSKENSPEVSVGNPRAELSPSYLLSAKLPTTWVTGQNSETGYNALHSIFYQKPTYRQRVGTSTLDVTVHACILSLDSDQATLSNTGGKGKNLALLSRAGFPVPPGFILSTAAYTAYVQATHLNETIQQTLKDLDPVDMDALASASQSIRNAFRAGHFPADLSDALQQAYADLGCPPVAVRSSATAEDLPGFSFAGQQDTFLHVVGDKALRRAVVECWSSLWTARAIGYRARNNIQQDNIQQDIIPPEGLSLAVIVQEMVPSETSGVLFTADPLTGRRDQVVVDATFGLGEALVSGQVEPDHYVVDAIKGHILEKTLGAKALAIHGQEGGGTVVQEVESAAEQALSDPEILDLARLGLRIEALLGTPQDVEWANVRGQLYVLQSRPITTLYPLLEDTPLDPLTLTFSFGAVQGMLDPLTPLGRDTIKGIFVGGARIFGYRFDLDTQPTILEAGERLWINVNGLINNRLGRKMALDSLDFVEPSITQCLRELVKGDELPDPGLIQPRTVLRLLRVILPAVARALLTLLRPDAQRKRLQADLDSWLGRMQNEIRDACGLSDHCEAFQSTLTSAFDFIIPRFVPCFGMGMATYRLLTKLVETLPQDLSTRPFDVQEMMRGLPHNVTTEMDLLLWHITQRLRADEASRASLTGDPADLATRYLAGELSPLAQQEIRSFLESYGMRGLGEIDLGRPRWREDPQPLIQVLQIYLQIDDPELAPDAVYERGKTSAQSEVERLVRALRHTRGGPIKARLARWAGKRMRALTGLRETPKYYMVCLFGLLREALLTDGQDLVDRGILNRPDDIFYLHLNELETLANNPAAPAGSHLDRRGPVIASEATQSPPAPTDTQHTWKTLIHNRRQAHAHEQRRIQIPLLLLSDGRALYGGSPTPSGSSTLSGSPVSPGTVEGRVRVVRDPRDAGLEPGEILVCPGTDPSWTPLFLVAGGLVMEVGGMMTHGAVVAREYGIPAVVGLHRVTERLHTGQRIRVDGSTGQIGVL